MYSGAWRRVQHHNSSASSIKYTCLFVMPSCWWLEKPYALRDFCVSHFKCVNEEPTKLNSKSVPPLLYCRCSWRYSERGTRPGGEHLTAHRVLTYRRRAGFIRHYTQNGGKKKKVLTCNRLRQNLYNGDLY